MESASEYLDLEHVVSLKYFSSPFKNCRYDRNTCIYIYRLFLKKYSSEFSFGNEQISATSLSYDNSLLYGLLGGNLRT